MGKPVSDVSIASSLDGRGGVCPACWERFWVERDQRAESGWSWFCQNEACSKFGEGYPVSKERLAKVV